MADGKPTSVLWGWSGYRVASCRREERRGQPWCVIELVLDHEVPRRCSGCGSRVGAVHDQAQRCIRDLPIFDAAVELQMPRLRLACPDCGPRLEQLDWLDPHSRVTRRLALSVARLCAATSVRHAAEWHRIDWKTAKSIDFRHLEATLGPPDLDGVRLLAMDEFAIQKGHRYATVIVDPERKRVLW